MSVRAAKRSTVVERFAAEREALREDRERVDELAAILRAGGFAILKLLVAQDRPTAFQTKAGKDVVQATQLIEALEELRPGEIRREWRSARQRGRDWTRALDRAAGLLREREPRLAARVGELAPR